ncbi:MAG: hypothetical protein LBS91_04375, partial [Clostridiales Family XIII bacterium]|nr:hypothetical protein [Clostridiales Family XIII bacterium]
AIASQLPVIARERSDRGNPLSAGLLRFARNDEASLSCYYKLKFFDIFFARHIEKYKYVCYALPDNHLTGRMMGKERVLL